MGKQSGPSRTRAALTMSINARLPVLPRASGDPRLSILPHSCRCCCTFGMWLKHFVGLLTKRLWYDHAIRRGEALLALTKERPTFSATTELSAKVPRHRLAGSTSLEQRTHLKLVRPLQIGRAPEFVGGKARRSRPKSRSRSKRSVRNSQKPQRSHFGDVGFRRIEWCTPNSPTCIRSQQPFGGPKHRKPTHPLRGNTNATGRSDFKPTPLLPNASTPLRAGPGQTQGPKRGSGRAISRAPGQICGGRVPSTRRDREREHPTHASGWRAPPSPERIGRSGRDEIFRPTYFPFPS